MQTFNSLEMNKFRGTEFLYRSTFSRSITKLFHKHACISTLKSSFCFALPLFLLLTVYTDIDECSDSTLNMCDPNANCTNIDGGYMCMCLDGYMGDGEICPGNDFIKTFLSKNK